MENNAKNRRRIARMCVESMTLEEMHGKTYTCARCDPDEQHPDVDYCDDCQAMTQQWGGE